MPVSIIGNSGIQFPDSSLQTAAASPYVLKNRIINGAMMIDQRNAGASVTQTTADLYPVDRFRILGSVTSKFTGQRSNTAPTGFTNSLLLTSSAATSLAAGDFYICTQKIEGFNIADLAWGTASAATVTLSFWTRSSLTGTFGGALLNDAANRSYPFTYTISLANTWEYKTVTIAGDTTGTWLTTNSTGMFVNFGLGVGTTYSGTAGAWAGAFYFSATGATSVVGTSGATFYITGVQLEIGSTATPFERRLYGNELALCQRYYEVLYQDAAQAAMLGVFYVTNGYGSTWYFKQEKRATATLSRVGGSWFNATPTLYNGISTGSAFSTVYFYVAAAAGVRVMEASAEL